MIRGDEAVEPSILLSQYKSGLPHFRQPAFLLP